MSTLKQQFNGSSLMESPTMEEEKVKCSCGAEFKIIMASCGYINCPICREQLKIGACE